MKSLIKNKKGGIGIIIFFLVLLGLLVVGFIAVMLWSVVDIASDELTPIMEGLGVVDGTSTNLSQYATYGFGTANTVVQAFPLIIAVGYIMALIFTLVFIFLVGYSPHPAFIGFYFLMMILLIFGAIVMSNMYQDIYVGTDELALRLQEQSTMSYLILHSPLILTFIAVVGGILMFTRQSSSEGGGGFGV